MGHKPSRAPRCQQQGHPYQGLLSGCSSGTHNPLLCVLSPLGYLGSFPRRRKFRLEQNNSKHRCGHSCLQCPGPCPPAATRRATQGRRRITQAGSRPGWPQGAWPWGAMEGHHGLVPRYGTAGHKRECPEPLGHTGAQRTGLGTAARGTEGHGWGEAPVPRHLCLLHAAAGWNDAHWEHRGSCPSGDEFESSKLCPRRPPLAHRHHHRLPRQAAWMPGSAAQPQQPALGTVSRFPSPPMLPTGCSLPEQGEASRSRFPPGWVGSPLAAQPGAQAGCPVPWRASRLLLSHLSGSSALCKRRKSLSAEDGAEGAACSARDAGWGEEACARRLGGSHAWGGHV